MSCATTPRNVSSVHCSRELFSPHERGGVRLLHPPIEVVSRGARRGHADFRAVGLPLRASVGSTEAPLREVTVVGDHRSDGRFLEASASLQAEGAHLNQHSQPSSRGCPFAIPRPSCALIWTLGADAWAEVLGQVSPSMILTRTGAKSDSFSVVGTRQTGPSCKYRGRPS
jgi:hypothetical protein